jgi:hypothetical protein
MARFQNEWLRKKPRKSGLIWVFCYRRQRPEDGDWVQATPFTADINSDCKYLEVPPGAVSYR